MVLNMETEPLSKGGRYTCVCTGIVGNETEAGARLYKEIKILEVWASCSGQQG